MSEICETPVNNSAAEAVLGAKRYRAGALRWFKIDRDRQLAYAEPGGHAIVLSTAEARILCSCEQPLSIQEHAARIAREFRLPAGGFDEAPRIVRTLINAGVLFDIEDLTPPAGVQRESAARIAWIVIPTGNRLPQVRRALASYAASCLRFGHKNGFIVADDSPRLEEREAVRDSCLTVADQFGARVIYVGVDEKRAYAEALIKLSGVSRDTIDFALFGDECCGQCIGANRNTLLLVSAGDLIFGTDDDTTSDAASIEGAGSGLVLGGRDDPTEFWFYPSREAAIAAGCQLDYDVLDAHEQILGADLRRLVAVHRQDCGVAFHAPCNHLLQALTSGTGRVLMTMNGVIGDSAMYSGVMLPVHGGEGTFQRLTRSREDYESALTSREVIRSVTRVTVKHGPPWMSTFCGLDNRALLPPWLPVLRNEDMVFGNTLEACNREGYVAHLPSALSHLPAERGSYSPGYREAISSIRFSDIVIAFIAGHYSSADEPRQRMERLGKHLEELGSLPAEDFEEHLRLLMLARASQLALAHEGILHQRKGAPAYFVQDVKAQLGRLQTAVRETDYVVPSDLGRHICRAGALARTQELLRRFGKLLTAWPALHDAAKNLRAHGSDLAESAEWKRV
jgi:hypothetical protein